MSVVTKKFYCIVFTVKLIFFISVKIMSCIAEFVACIVERKIDTFYCLEVPL